MQDQIYSEEIEQTLAERAARAFVTTTNVIVDETDPLPECFDCECTNGGVYRECCARADLADLEKNWRLYDAEEIAAIEWRINNYQNGTR